MYHLGIIQKVLKPDKGGNIKSADDSTQAVIRMWDENLLIILVDKKLSSKLKEKDYVIADYSPVTPESPNRKMIINKILPKDLGKKMWHEFEQELERKKARMQESRPSQSYPYIR